MGHIDQASHYKVATEKLYFYFCNTRLLVEFSQDLKAFFNSDPLKNWPSNSVQISVKCSF